MDKRGMLPALAVLVVAGWMLAAYWGDAGALWRDPYHDRNSHFAAGLGIALALRTGDAAGLFLDLVQPSVWPPLQALLLGGWMAVAGPDLRWAVLPALAGWVVALLGLWPLCRAAAPGRADGALAAGIAIALGLGSPAFRLLGADAMQEALGAALSVLVLAVALRRPLHWRMLALLLTLLALHKYNYWAMAVAALLLAHPRAVWRWGAGLLRGTTWRDALRDPVPRAGALVFGAAALLLPADPALRAGGVLLLPATAAAFAWGLAALAAARARRRRSAAFDAALGAGPRALLGWHALPVALWLMVPGKLTALLWFLAPTHRGATPPHGLLEGIAFHWQGFAQGFSAGPWLAGAILLLALAGSVRAPRPVTVFVALGIAALVVHPQLQWRFQASVLPAVWALAGIGAAWLVPAAWRAGAAWAVPVALGAALLALPAPLLADAAAIRRPAAPRDLDLAAAWAGVPVAPDGVLVLASFGRSDLFDWTIRLRCGCRAPVEQPPWSALGPGVAAAAVATTPAPWLLAVEAPAPYPLAGQAAPLALPVGALLAAQQRFAQAGSVAVPAHDARVSAWQATAPPEGPGPPRRRHVTLLAAGLLAVAVLATLLAPGRRQGEARRGRDT
jgi:hypothetical protein